MGMPGPQKINRYGIAFKLKTVQMSKQPASPTSGASRLFTVTTPRDRQEFARDKISAIGSAVLLD